MDRSNAERGALERYFRPEGNYGDGVGVIPIDVGNKIRLYCLRLSDKILVFGNGGVKDSKTWQESETLAPYVRLLVDTSRFSLQGSKMARWCWWIRGLLETKILQGMRRSKVLEERRKRVSPEIRNSVALSFRIVDRIHEILVEKGMKQKDLALRLGKSEAEISKWMRGTHNFTIDTLVSIEDALEAPIIQVYLQPSPFHEFDSIVAAEPLLDPVP